MEKENVITLNLIKEHLSKITNSPLPNPIYGKIIFLFKGCAKPRLERNQLLGYLGAFSGNYHELTNEIDICVIPHQSYQKFKNGETDEVIETINGKFNVYNEKTNRYTNTVSNTLFVPEKQFFKFIKEQLIENDQVKVDQFNRINFPYSI